MRVTCLLVLTALAVSWTSLADAYRDDVEAFRAHRADEILGPGGWASLVDLHWVSPGQYTLGRAASNAIALPAPSAPDRIGTLTVTPDGATLALDAGVTATVKGAPVRTVALTVNGEANTALVIGKVSMVVIRRGTRLALRVWDEASPTRLALHGLAWIRSILPGG
jgi:uncharacterized protein (DUF1684 family)